MGEVSKKLNLSSVLCDENNSISKYDVDLSSLNLPESDQRVAFILENIFTPEECQALITLAEENQFATALVNFGGQDVLDQNVRSGLRVIMDGEEFTSQLWSRISSFIPVKVNGARVVGLNERLRFLKYVPGQFFLPHTDGNYVRPYNNLEMSLLTIQMYLNEGFDGGETTFLPYFPQHGQEQRIEVPVKPKSGMALIFSQEIKHEGSLVKSGVKYTVRTDIMYKYGAEQGYETLFQP